MRGLDRMEVEYVAGGVADDALVARPGVSQWEWDILVRQLDEQARQDRYRQEK